jgi:hypothetical protein
MSSTNALLRLAVHCMISSSINMLVVIVLEHYHLSKNAPGRHKRLVREQRLPQGAAAAY